VAFWPQSSGIGLQYEYNVAAPAAGLNPENIKTAQKNALKIYIPG
jgi:adenosine deaminase